MAYNTYPSKIFAGNVGTHMLGAAIGAFIIVQNMEFMTPKGKMRFRQEDHQALQSMFAFELDVKPDVAWAIPVLTKTLTLEETAPPIMNK